MKDLAQVPAVVTEVSRPSFAGKVSGCNQQSGHGLTHVRGDKHPLWQSIVREVSVEHGEILQLCQTI